MPEPGGPMEIGPVWIGPEPDFEVGGIGGSTNYNAPPEGMADHLSAVMAVTDYTEKVIKLREEEIKKRNEEDIANIDPKIDQGIKGSGGSNAPMSSETPPETVLKELGIVSRMRAETQGLANNRLQEAQSFFVGIPMKDSGYELVDFYPNNLAGPSPDYKLLTDWATAYYSYKVSQVYSEMANRLKAKEDALIAITAEQTRIAAEAEAQRVAAEAAEQARLAAEAEAKRVADEQARIAAEAEAQRVAAEAAEQARLAAEAEAKRVADEQARIAAEAEAQRVAAEAAEQARLAAEAEAKRVADEQARIAAEAEAQRVAAEAAEQARLAAELIRIANTFRAPGPASAAGPLFMTSAGTVAVIEAAAITLQAAIRAAITALGGLVASVGAGFAVGVSALFYSSKLANGELSERYAFSTPVSDLASDLGQDLNAVAAAGGTVDLPYRLSSKTTADGQSEVFVVKTDGVTVPSKVRVVAATYDAAQKVYTATTTDVPPRTLTWTPIVNPGNSSTTSPAEQPAPPVYTGATITPVEGRVDTFPGVSEASFDDFITVFPADSGLPPIYTMFRDRREDPGVATGVGQPVSGIWLGAASQGEGAPIPSQIADQLRGKEFKNFRAFREALWEAVANDANLAQQFIVSNRDRMITGKAAKSRKVDSVGKRSSFEIHHVDEVAKGGDVYNIDNMRIFTPKRHIDIHKGVK